jgi:hypothetical protein
MEKIANNNVIKLFNASNSEEFIVFYFEKSLLKNHCNVSITLKLNNQTCSLEKWTVSIDQIVKMANWYNTMPLDSTARQNDLIIEDANLEFTNYFFEKGEGYYYLSYTSEAGKKFKFHFWEQLDNSNTVIFENLMECLKNCK